MHYLSGKDHIILECNEMAEELASRRKETYVVGHELFRELTGSAIRVDLEEKEERSERRSEYYKRIYGLRQANFFLGTITARL